MGESEGERGGDASDSVEDSTAARLNGREKERFTTTTTMVSSSTILKSILYSRYHVVIMFRNTRFGIRSVCVIVFDT